MTLRDILKKYAIYPIALVLLVGLVQVVRANYAVIPQEEYNQHQRLEPVYELLSTHEGRQAFMQAETKASIGRANEHILKAEQILNSMK